MSANGLGLLPTTGVGSFPKPDYVRGARGRLDENSRRATEEFIRKQEGIGVDVLVDGELYRGDMATDYARALGLPVADWTRSYGNRFWKKGIVDRDLVRNEPIQLEQFGFAQSLTERPVKGMLTGPTTLTNWILDSHYKDREKLLRAWAEIVDQEALDLEEAGARYIQIDEPAIGEWVWEEDLFREGLEISRKGLKEDTYLITHICYGNFSDVYHRLKYLPVHQIDIETSGDLDLGKKSDLLSMMKEDPLTMYKDVAVGVIDVRPGVPVESVGTVVNRIYQALEVLAPNDGMLERIWISPDCGFRTTKDPDVAYRKMEVMQRAVEEVREGLGKTRELRA